MPPIHILENCELPCNLSQKYYEIATNNNDSELWVCRRNINICFLHRNDLVDQRLLYSKASWLANFGLWWKLHDVLLERSYHLFDLALQQERVNDREIDSRNKFHSIHYSTLLGHYVAWWSLEAVIESSFADYGFCKGIVYP